MRVLVADDDRLTVAILTSALEDQGLEVTVARDGNQAWEVIGSDAQIGLAILDWMMPGLDGPELCRRIRRDERFSQLYVLLLTSRDSRADLVAGLNAGANDYLTKPCDRGELGARIQVGLRMISLQQKLSAQVAELQAALAKVKQLSGLLPICSYCKAVRSDHNYWERVDQYITEHTDVQFSHGICPACFEKIAGDLPE
jgi:DNA-binding response OmpR family regulator